MTDETHDVAPDTCPLAILIVDMINDLEFPEGPELLEPALAAARGILILKKRARELKIPVIYANDNFGRWRSDFNEVVDHCLMDNVRGRPLAELLHPERDDYFVLKPKHSAFFATTLDTLLRYLQVQHLVITGLSTDICVLFSANDAYLRDLNISVPRDCVAASLEEHTRTSLEYMARVLSADTAPSSEIDLAGLVAKYSSR